MYAVRYGEQINRRYRRWLIILSIHSYPVELVWRLRRPDQTALFCTHAPCTRVLVSRERPGGERANEIANRTMQSAVSTSYVRRMRNERDTR